MDTSAILDLTVHEVLPVDGRRDTILRLMVELTRTVRFCLNSAPPGAPPDAPSDGLPADRHNTFSAWPAMRGLGRYYQLQVCCVGQADPLTGYFLNIKEIDTAARDHVLPYLLQQVQNESEPALGNILQEMIERLQPPLGGTVKQVRFDLTPYYSLSIRSDDMSQVIMRQQFEFAAAHRLHVDALSDEENRRVFGKCNNPSGHGHNYQLEVAVRVPIDGTGQVMAVEELDQMVDSVVIEKLDHKHLNKDVAQFQELNPSVENIAKVIWKMLGEGAKGLGGQGVKLEEVSVWETGKTVCTYRGDG